MLLFLLSPFSIVLLFFDTHVFYRYLSSASFTEKNGKSVAMRCPSQAYLR